MTHRKGQGAMEYLMTYGWAILVVIIVGIVLLNMGVLNLGGGSSQTKEGFSGLMPADWTCNSATGDITVSMANGAGDRIYNITVVGGAACTPDNVAAGGTTTCVVSAAPGCAGVNAGEAFDAQVSVSFTGPTGLPKTSSGSLRGAAQ